MKRVLLIDPWGIHNTSEYLNGLIFGLSKLVELEVFTNAYFELKIQEVTCKIHRVFFPKSEHMETGRKRSVLRGIEYIGAYHQILWFLRKNGPYDIVHINWLLFYPLDIHFLKWLKKHCKKLVYTAHNVLPHENGESQIGNLAKIYQTVDRIILHGEHIKTEFTKYFPAEAGKVFIQSHGANLFPQTGYELSMIPIDLQKKLGNYEKIYICFGNMFYNKGADRLVKIWKKNRELDSTLLIIAGRVSSEYKELLELIEEQQENILVFNQYLEDHLLNYLIDQSDLILLPYRHASMSGVVFTAADFQKPVLCTDVGAIGEYIVSGEDGIIVKNDDTELEKAIINSLEVTLDEFKQWGEMLHTHIQTEYGWASLGEKIVGQCYTQNGYKKE